MVHPGSVRPNSPEEPGVHRPRHDSPLVQSRGLDRPKTAAGMVATWRRRPDGRAALSWAVSRGEEARRRLTQQATHSKSVRRRPGGTINLIWVEGSEGSGLRVAA